MKTYILLLTLLFTTFSPAQQIPANAKKLIDAYPNQIKGFKNNNIIFKDNTTLVYDDGKKKTAQQLLDNPDIEDQFLYPYTTGKSTSNTKAQDPGRIRNEEFFKKIYGNSKAAVEQQLVNINWCPKLVNQKIKVTSANGLDKIVKSLSAELDTHPELKKYLTNIGGTFNWRMIAGTKRLSMHSFGMTIDINVKYSNYWQWDCKCKSENTKLSYKNQIPEQLIAIFEKHGFIWGGKWYHYDTMHFEYRPELLN